MYMSFSPSVNVEHTLQVSAWILSGPAASELDTGGLGAPMVTMQTPGASHDPYPGNVRAKDSDCWWQN